MDGASVYAGRYAEWFVWGIIWRLRINNAGPMMTSSNGNIFRVTGPLCREFTGPGEFPTQRPVTRSLDVFFDLRLNKRLSKQPWGWWYETLSWSLWRHCNDHLISNIKHVYVERCFHPRNWDTAKNSFGELPLCSERSPDPSGYQPGGTSFRIQKRKIKR